jgi:hypothetical protein
MPPTTHSGLDEIGSRSVTPRTVTARRDDYVPPQRRRPPVKRNLIALVLGTLLALNVASIAAAKVSIVGLPNTDLIPDSGSSRTVIDAGSRLSARLRAIDAFFYPDTYGAESGPRILDVSCEILTADRCFGSGV